MARPKKAIDADQVEKLAAINCSYAEMASVLDCDESTLTRRFAQAIKKGRDRGRASLKRKQYEMAMNGNVTLLIWLGKINCGQVEQVRQVVDSRNVNVNTEVQSTEELKELLSDLGKLINTKVNERGSG